MSALKITSTKNYRLFERHSNENRPLDIKKHRALVASMKLYGWLACFPMVVLRNAKGGPLIVKDGQHRLAIAESLGLAVHYVVDDSDFDVAVVNSAAKPWVIRDYAQKFAANGLKQYQEAIDFADNHGLPLGKAVALLSGTTDWGNVQSSFTQGIWKIKDRDWAEAVAGIYVPMVRLSPVMSNARFLDACMAVCRVDGFDADRMIANAGRCRHMLVAYSTRDAYLLMMEEVYNFGRQKLMGLKSAATEAMRDRCAVKKNGDASPNGKTSAAVKAKT